MVAVATNPAAHKNVSSVRSLGRCERVPQYASDSLNLISNYKARPKTEKTVNLERAPLEILVDAETKRILGASLLGIECDEVIHSLLDVMYAKAPYTVIQRAMHIHPTVSELIPTMLGDLKPLE